MHAYTHSEYVCVCVCVSSPTLEKEREGERERTCVAVCCSVLQCTAYVFADLPWRESGREREKKSVSSALQCVAVCFAVRCIVLQCVVQCVETIGKRPVNNRVPHNWGLICSGLQRVAIGCRALQCAALCCCVLLRVEGTFSVFLSLGRKPPT